MLIFGRKLKDSSVFQITIIWSSDKHLGCSLMRIFFTFIVEVGFIMWCDSL